MDVKVHLYVNKDEIKKYLFSLRNSFENGYEHQPYILSENDKISTIKKKLSIVLKDNKILNSYMWTKEINNPFETNSKQDSNDNSSLYSRLRALNYTILNITYNENIETKFDITSLTLSDYEKNILKNQIDETNLIEGSFESFTEYDESKIKVQIFNMRYDAAQIKLTETNMATLFKTLEVNDYVQIITYKNKSKIFKSDNYSSKSWDSYLKKEVDTGVSVYLNIDPKILVQVTILEEKIKIMISKDTTTDLTYEMFSITVFNNIKSFINDVIKKNLVNIQVKIKDLKELRFESVQLLYNINNIYNKIKLIDFVHKNLGHYVISYKKQGHDNKFFSLVKRTYNDSKKEPNKNEYLQKMLSSSNLRGEYNDKVNNDSSTIFLSEKNREYIENIKVEDNTIYGVKGNLCGKHNVGYNNLSILFYPNTIQEIIFMKNLLLFSHLKVNDLNRKDIRQKLMSQSTESFNDVDNNDVDDDDDDDDDDGINDYDDDGINDYDDDDIDIDDNSVEDTEVDIYADQIEYILENETIDFVTKKTTEISTNQGESSLSDQKYVLNRFFYFFPKAQIVCDEKSEERQEMCGYQSHIKADKKGSSFSFAKIQVPLVFDNTMKDIIVTNYEKLQEDKPKPYFPVKDMVNTRRIQHFIEYKNLNLLSSDAFCFECNNALSYYDFDHSKRDLICPVCSERSIKNNVNDKNIRHNEKLLLQFSRTKKVLRGYSIIFINNNNDYPIRSLDYRKWVSDDNIFEELNVDKKTDNSKSQVKIYSKTLNKGHYGKIVKSENDIFHKFMGNSQSEFVRYSSSDERSYLRFLLYNYNEILKTKNRDGLTMSLFKKKTIDRINNNRVRLGNYLNINDSNYFDNIITLIEKDKLSHDIFQDIATFPDIIFDKELVNIFMFDIPRDSCNINIFCNKMFHDSSDVKILFGSFMREKNGHYSYYHIIGVPPLKKDKIDAAKTPQQFIFNHKDKCFGNLYNLRQNCSKIYSEEFFKYYMENKLSIRRRSYNALQYEHKETISDFIKKEGFEVHSQLNVRDTTSGIYIRHKSKLFLIPIKYMYPEIKDISNVTELIDDQTMLPNFEEALDFYNKHTEFTGRIVKAIKNFKGTHITDVILESNEVFKIKETKISENLQMIMKKNNIVAITMIINNKDKEVDKDITDKFTDDYTKFWKTYETLLLKLSDEFFESKSTDLIEFINKYSPLKYEIDYFELLKTEIKYNNYITRVLNKEQQPKYLIQKMLYETPVEHIISNEEKQILIDNKFFTNNINSQIEIDATNKFFESDKKNKGLKLHHTIQNMTHIDFRYFDFETVKHLYNFESKDISGMRDLIHNYNTKTIVNLKKLLSYEFNVVVFEGASVISHLFDKNKESLFFYKNSNKGCVVLYPVKYKDVKIKPTEISTELMNKLVDDDDSDDDDLLCLLDSECSKDAKKNTIPDHGVEESKEESKEEDEEEDEEESEDEEYKGKIYCKYNPKKGLGKNATCKTHDQKKKHDADNCVFVEKTKRCKVKK